MNNKLTDTSYWEELKRTEVGHGSIVFSNLLKKYLNKETNGKIALEIGCVPGIFLAYICENFNYFPEGIDYVHDAKEITEKTLKNFKLNESKIYENDFIKWNAQKKYDLVCSFGFIEHFKSPDLIINKHLELLKDGGRLIIEIPNFNYGQKALKKIFDRDNLDKHNTDIMNLNYFKKIADKHNLQIDFLGYYGGLFKFWSDNKSFSSVKKMIYKLVRVCSYFLSIIPWPNKFFSPFIVLIATKKITWN